MLRNLIIAFTVALGLNAAPISTPEFAPIIGTTVAEAANCTAANKTGCPPPKAVQWSGKSSKRFLEECRWLPFPTRVRQPIIFLKEKGDDACIGPRWRSACPECVDWVAGKRGPVNGPARGAKIVWRLHNGQTGISVPKHRYAAIKAAAGWCDYGVTGKFDSNHF